MEKLKRCSKCKLDKKLPEFYKHLKYKDGKYPSCIACRKLYIELNKDKIKIQKKKYDEVYYENNKLKIREYNKLYYREYYLKNKNEILDYTYKYNTRNKIKIAKTKKEYATNNKDKINTRNRKHQAIKLKASPKWLDTKDWDIIASKYELALYLTEQTDIPWHVDHIIPLKGKNICGLHVPWNLRVIPAEENCTKCNKIKEQQ